MYKLYLSLRFLLHHWLMTLIGSFFVGASLAILVVVMAVMDGFQTKLRQSYAGSSADLTVTPRFPVDVPAFERVLLDELGDLAVAAGPYFQTITMLRKEGRVDPALEQELHVGVVFGIDGRKEQRINFFGQYIQPPSNPRLGREQDPDTPDSVPQADGNAPFVEAPFELPDELDRAIGRVGVIVGEALLREMGLMVGQNIRIMTVQPTAPGSGSLSSGGGGNSEAGYDLKNGLFRIVGAYRSGNHEIDSRCVFMHHEAFRGFFNESTSRPAVRLKLSSPDAYDQAKRLLHLRLDSIARRTVKHDAERLPNDLAMGVQTWQDLNRTLVSAIESEKSMILVIAFLIVVAGTSSIFAAQWLLVTDKIREIGLLRALGARVLGVTALFVANGFLMGLLGSAGGVGAGLLIVRYIDHVEDFISFILGREVFDPRIYMFQSVPTYVDMDQVLQYAGAALVCTLIAAAIPALRAGFMDPARALHRD